MIFQRVIFDKDGTTGKLSALGNEYRGTKGPSNVADIKNEVPKAPLPYYDLSPDTCTNEQWESVLDGTALIKEWIVMTRTRRTCSRTRRTRAQPRVRNARVRRPSASRPVRENFHISLGVTVLRSAVFYAPLGSFVVVLYVL